MRKRLLAVLLIAPILLIAAANIRVAPPICDGGYPAWAGDPCGSDEYVPPSLLDYVWPPEHWFAADVCSGLCTDLEH